MKKQDSTALVKQELYQALAYFIERQDLVAQAMLDMGLDLDEVGTFGALAWVSSTTHILKDVEKPMDLFTEGSDLFEVSKRAEAIRVSQKGTWKDYDHNEWEYYLHGEGCRLTNRQTSEVIDWDCPNKLSFDPWFFSKHLAWQLEASDRKRKLTHTRAWLQATCSGLSWNAIVSEVRRLIDEMIEEGLIKKDWTLAN